MDIFWSFFKICIQLDTSTYGIYIYPYKVRKNATDGNAISATLVVSTTAQNV